MSTIQTFPASEITTWPSRPTAPPAPGIYGNIPFAEYLRINAWSHSDMKLCGEWDNDIKSFVPAPFRTPAHLFHRLNEGPPEPTKDQIKGTKAHCLYFEPDRFKREFHVLPAAIKDRRSNANKAAIEAAEAQFGDDRVLMHEEFLEFQGFAFAAADHDLVRPLIGAVGRTELTVVWIDEETGLTCKGRFDKLIEAAEQAPCIIDYKTTVCAHWRLFERQFAALGYDLQAAAYTDGATAQLGTKPIFRVIAQEKSPPYLCVVGRVREETLDSGRTKYRAALREIKRCLTTGVWPGYADNHEIELDVPVWAHAEPADPSASNPQEPSSEHDYSADITVDSSSPEPESAWG